MAILITQARVVARRWVLTEGIRLPGFAGAFLTGSTLWAAERAVLAADADVDVTVVVDSPAALAMLGKFVYEGVLLEVSLIPSDELGSAETVLSDYHLAGSFHLPNVLADPTGRLTEIQDAVSRHFAERRWVEARCNAAMDRVRGYITGMDPSMPFPDQVSSWLFGTGVMTHVLLVAGLQNPTIRRRYEAVRELLAAHDQLYYYETLLDLLGCAHMSPARVLDHLDALEAVFDTAKDVAANSYRFASDVSPAARSISIDGSRHLIERGLHREAVFWLVATYSRCLTKLSVAGVDSGAYQQDFHELLAELGAESFEDRRRRGDRVLAALPELWRQAEELMPAPPRGHAYSNVG